MPKTFKMLERGLFSLWVTVATCSGTIPITDISVMWHMETVEILY